MTEDRIHSRDEIGGGLINEVPDAACLVGNEQELRVLVQQACCPSSTPTSTPRLAPCFASRQVRLNYDVQLIQPLPRCEGFGQEHFNISYNTGNKKPASAISQSGFDSRPF